MLQPRAAAAPVLMIVANAVATFPTRVDRLLGSTAAAKVVVLVGSALGVADSATLASARSRPASHHPTLSQIARDLLRPNKTSMASPPDVHVPVHAAPAAADTETRLRPPHGCGIARETAAGIGAARIAQTAVAVARTVLLTSP